jgi:hypothetical protein
VAETPVDNPGLPDVIVPLASPDGSQSAQASPANEPLPGGSSQASSESEPSPSPSPAPDVSQPDYAVSPDAVAQAQRDAQDPSEVAQPDGAQDAGSGQAQQPAVSNEEAQANTPMPQSFQEAEAEAAEPSPATMAPLTTQNSYSTDISAGQKSIDDTLGTDNCAIQKNGQCYFSDGVTQQTDDNGYPLLAPDTPTSDGISLNKIVQALPSLKEAWDEYQKLTHPLETIQGKIDEQFNCPLLDKDDSTFCPVPLAKKAIQNGAADDAAAQQETVNSFIDYENGVRGTVSIAPTTTPDTSN